MLTFEEIEDCFPHGSKEMEDGITGVNAQWLHDFAHAVAEKEREACVKICRDASAYAKENAARLKEYPGEEEEARCRELASSYLDEAAWLMDMRSNVKVRGG